MGVRRVGLRFLVTCSVEAISQRLVSSEFLSLRSHLDIYMLVSNPFHLRKFFFFCDLTVFTSLFEQTG